MMGQTIAEKILAAHVGRPGGRPRSAAPTGAAPTGAAPACDAPAEEPIVPGRLVEVRVDLVLANDITAPIAIREFERIGVGHVFDPQRVVLVPDHFAPNKDIRSAEQCRMMRDFARAQGIANYFEVGRMGIEHVLVPDSGLVRPGDVVVGADSHTCTYGALGAFATGMGSTDIAVAMATGSIWMRVPETVRVVYRGQRQPWVGGKDLILYTIGLIGVDGARYQAIEFDGPAIAALPMSGRFTMANMAIEAGAKVGLFAVDGVTRAYLEEIGKSEWTREILRFPFDRLRASAQNDNSELQGGNLRADVDAAYARTIEVDVSGIEPQVAFPHLPGNVRPISQVGEVPIDQAVIGSCTNGRWDDLVVAAEVLGGRKVHPDVRCIVIPGTQEIALRAMRQGIAEAFVEAGAVFSTPTCGPCLGGYMGVLAAGERCISTTNRNFVGRMGHPESEVYLANPAVAAASAVLGRIAGPQEVMT